MKGIMRVINVIVKVLNFIAILALLVMIGVTVADVFMRLFFTAPIMGLCVQIPSSPLKKKS